LGTHHNMNLEDNREFYL